MLKKKNIKKIIILIGDRRLYCTLSPGFKSGSRGHIAVAIRGVHSGSVHVASDEHYVRHERDKRRPVRPGDQFRDIQIHDVLQSNTVHHLGFTLQRERIKTTTINIE